MAQVLAGGNRRFAGATAPAAGLYLWRVEYPPAFGIPAPPDGEILPSSMAAPHRAD
jgi:tRNA pseudouridine38-40 synthase